MEWAMTKQSRPLEYDHKPKKCPACGHNPILSILYGEIETTIEELESENGRFKNVTFGGCCYDVENSPHWECDKCDWTGRKKRLN